LALTAPSPPSAAGLGVFSLTTSHTPIMSMQVMAIERQVWQLLAPRRFSICGIVRDFATSVIVIAKAALRFWRGPKSWWVQSAELALITF
jgi:hypothetical protein